MIDNIISQDISIIKNAVRGECFMGKRSSSQEGQALSAVGFAIFLSISMLMQPL